MEESGRWACCGAATCCHRDGSGNSLGPPHPGPWPGPVNVFSLSLTSFFVSPAGIFYKCEVYPSCILAFMILMLGRGVMILP